jgi:hypothetical protein
VLRQEYRAYLSRSAWLANVGFLPLALLASRGLFAIHGIPITHDGMGLVQIEAYRRAYRALELFPVWASCASHGHGSPFPILYHRLHGQVFGAIALLTGSLVALKLSIPLLLVIGAIGMRRLCLGQGARPWVAWVAGALFLSSNYVFCDWFVRGAIAEFTAFMLVPWCLHYTIRTLDETSSPVWMALFGALLFLAHMMTAYFYAFMVLAVLVTRLVRMRGFGWRRTRETWRRLVVFSALVIAATGLFAAASQYALGFSHVSTFGMRADKDAYLTWSATLFDPNLSWVKAFHTGEMTVEIGRWPLLFLGMVLLVERTSRAAVWRSTHGMLVPIAIFFILQDKRLSFVFDLLPGAAKVQFPCRLLTFIVPIALLAFAVAIEHALRSRAPVARWIGVLSPLAAAAQLSLIVQLQRHVRDHQYEVGKVDVALWNRDVTRPPLMIYATWDGFLPEGLATVARTPFLWASPGCTISSARLTHGQNTTDVSDEIEFNSLELTVHGTGCRVHFAEFRTPLLAIETSKPGFSYADTDGTTIIDVPNDATVVRISQRSIADLALRWAVQQLRSPPS